MPTTLNLHLPVQQEGPYIGCSSLSCSSMVASVSKVFMPVSRLARITKQIRAFCHRFSKGTNAIMMLFSWLLSSQEPEQLDKIVWGMCLLMTRFAGSTGSPVFFFGALQQIMSLLHFLTSSPLGSSLRIESPRSLQLTSHRNHLEPSVSPFCVF